ncbi:MAG: galactokinase [Acidimicrobiia bacterium]
MGRRTSTAWRAPGRVNLIGDHTDYAEGLVLPMAIDRECVVAVTAAGGDSVRARSSELDGEVVCATGGRDDARRSEPSWGGFVVGAVQALTDRGARVPGVELRISSSVPAGSGLSSSSALSVALVLALADASGLELARTEVARAALDAEVRATGVPGGLMDQLAAVHGVAGAAVLIDCRDLSIDAVPLPARLAVVVAHSGVARTLAGSAYAERRAATEAAAARLGLRALRDATLAQVQDDPRARHVVTENARVADFAAALRAGDIDALGPLLLASHASLRDDFEVSTPELDALVDAFVESGALGARLTGAGFGGCVVALASRDGAERVMTDTARAYRERTGRATTPFVVEAVDGAGPTSSGAGRPSSDRTLPE